MRARSAAAPIVEPCTGSAAITAGIAHTATVLASTIDHRRHAPRRRGLKLGKFTGGAASPLLPPNHRTMRGRPDAPLRGSSALAVMCR